MRLCFAIAVLSIALAGCDQQMPSTFVNTPYDEQEMEAAIKRARSGLDSFIAELEQPTGTGHAVKVQIEDSEDVEYFWLGDLRYENGEFTGTINNHPGLVGNVEEGQEWTVGKSEVIDWTYEKDGKMYGHYTMRPLLKTMPKEEAEMFRSKLAEP